MIRKNKIGRIFSKQMLTFLYTKIKECSEVKVKYIVYVH